MIERTLANKLKDSFKKYPVVTLTGPRQSGKTTLCKTVFKDLPYVNLEEPDIRKFAQDDPRGFLKRYSEGGIIDEIQRVPDLVSYIQVLVDSKNKNSQFVLTGSEQFALSQTISQSLAGRTAVFHLLPFSLRELNLKKPELANFDEYIYKGFMPRIYDHDIEPNRALADYFETYVERDLRNLSQIQDLNTFRTFVKLCAGRIGNTINYNKLGSDAGISHSTVRQWLSLLEASYIIFRLEPFHKNIRRRLTKSPKLYFHDVGLARYLIGIENIQQIETHPLKGALFENLVISEALKNRFHNGKDNNLSYYQDAIGNEIDLLSTTGTGITGLEIKSSSTMNQAHTKNFSKFEKATQEILTKKFVVYAGNDIEAYGANFITPNSISTALEVN